MFSHMYVCNVVFKYVLPYPVRWMPMNFYRRYTLSQSSDAAPPDSGISNDCAGPIFTVNRTGGGREMRRVFFSPVHLVHTQHHHSTRLPKAHFR
jgi:hypothetical protein